MKKKHSCEKTKHATKKYTEVKIKTHLEKQKIRKKNTDVKNKTHVKKKEHTCEKNTQLKKKFDWLLRTTRAANWRLFPFLFHHCV